MSGKEDSNVGVDTDIGVVLDLETQMAMQMLQKFNNMFESIHKVMAEVNAVSSKTVDAYNKMSLASKRFDDINVSRVTSNINTLTKEIDNFGTRLNSLAFSKFNSGANTLADAMDRITSASKKFTKSTNVFSDLSSLGTINISPIEGLFSSLQKVNPANVNAIGNALKNLSIGAKGLQNLNFNIDVPNNMQNQLNSTANTLRDFVEKISKFNLNGLSSFAKDIKSIPRAMEGMQKLDVSKIGQVFSTLTTQIQPFIAKLKEASAEIQGLAKISSSIDRFGKYMKSAKDHTKQVGDEASITNRKLNNMLSAGKVYALYNQIRHFGSGVLNILNQAVDFTEIENYFSRAMGNMRSEAMKFQNELSNMFGLATPSMMKAQATFKNMLSSLGGLTDEFSMQMSERLTKMAVDFSSLYNVSIDSSITKFQAALSRQVRPIRSVSGYDITQNVLGTTLESIGIHDRTITKMNEMEKRLLIILTLQQQMARSSAMGDFAATLEQPANQLKVLQQQLSEVGRWISAVFYGIIGQVLPYINGFVMAIKQLIMTFATFLGYELPNSSGNTGTILDGIGDDVSNIGSGLGDVNDELDKAKKKTKEWKNFSASFDVFEKIPDQSDSDSDDDDDVGSGFVDPRILDALKNMDYLFGNIRMKAMDIRDQILAWSKQLGKIIDDNIFEPISNSWNKYGNNILKNAKSSFNDLKYIAGGVFEVVGEKWKPFFQQASNLFFSLLETGSIVLNSITIFFKAVWDNGGKYLFESLWNLATVFLELAVSFNDNFVKPLLSGLNQTLVPAFGTFLGFIAGLIGGVINALASIIDWIAKCEPLVIGLATAFTTLFLTIKISKFIELASAATGAHKIFKTLVDTMYDHNKIFKKAVDMWIGAEGGVKKIKTAFTAANTILKKWLTSLSLSLGLHARTTLALNAQAGATGLLTTMQNLCAKATLAFSSVLTFLAANPLVAVAMGIGIAVGALLLLGNTQKDKKYEMDDYTEGVQNQAKAAQELSNSLDEAATSAKNSYNEKLVDIDVVSSYIDKLREMGGDTGYVDNTELASYYVEKINSMLPDTVKFTEEGRLEWEKTPEAIYKNIEALKTRAEIQATEELYIQSIKDGLKAENDRTIATENLNDLLERRTKIMSDMRNGIKYNGEYDTAEKELSQLNADIDGLRGTVALCDENIKKTSESTKAFEVNMNSLGEETEGVTKTLTLSYKELSDKGNEAFNSVGTKYKELERQMAETAASGKELSEEEIKTRQETKDALIKEYAEQATSYGQSFDDLKDILAVQGVELNEDELKLLESSIKNNEETRASILQIVRKSGFEIKSEQETQYSDFLKAMQKSGLELKTEKSTQYEALFKMYEEHGKSMDSNQRYQLAQFISKTQQLGIDLNTIEGQQHLNSFIKAQQAGLDVGDVYISKMKQGVISKDINGEIDTILNNAQLDLNGKPVYVSIDAYINRENLDSAVRQMGEAIGSLKFKWHTKMEETHSANMFLQQYATGGFPNIGEFFIAREAGPEYVGRMGNRNVVANNDQITQGIYSAVLQAIRDGGTLQERGGDLYITIQNKDGSKTEQVIKEYKKYMMFSGGKGGFPV